MIDYAYLYAQAKLARSFSYCPYSHFAVGAALLCADGSVYLGCNVENASFGAGNCAERVAISKAVSDGKRDYLAIAILGGKEGQAPQFCPPCGICRQFMTEFCDHNAFEVVLYHEDGAPEVHHLSDLLPLQFTSTDLE